MGSNEALGGGYGEGTFGWLADLCGGPGLLAPETATGIRIQAWAPNYALGVPSAVVSWEQAIARLSLCAPCLPALMQREIDRTLAYRGGSVDPRYGMPPLAVVIDLLTAAAEVCAGRAVLADRQGVLVRHVLEPRRVLRASRGSEQLGEAVNVARLAALGVVHFESLAVTTEADASDQLPLPPDSA